MFETTEKGQRVIAEIRNAAAATPDKVTDSGGCLYVDTDSSCPSCLVGVGLWKAGLIDEEFALSGHNGTGILVMGHERWDFSRAEVIWMAIVQKAQDTQWNWAYAVALADARVLGAIMAGRDSQSSNLLDGIPAVR